MTLLGSIACCYRGCALLAWTPGPTGLEVACSSATCAGCRRVALCLEHFADVRAAQGGLACPNCGRTRWHVVVFESNGLSGALAGEVEQAGGRIEVRPPARPVAAAPKPRPHPPASLVPPLPPKPPAPPPSPWPQSLGVLRSGDLEERERAAGAGLVVRTSDASLVARRGELRRELALTGRAGRCAFSDEGLLVVVEVTPPGSPAAAIAWYTPEGRGCLANPHELDNLAPVILGNDAFLYRAARSDGRVDLLEARLEQGRRVRVRRIGAAARCFVGVPPVVLDRARTAMLFQEDDEGLATPVCVRLADGRSFPVGSPQPPPTAAAGARRGTFAAWINGEGEVRCGGADHVERVLGRTNGNLVAVSPGGDQVAWYGGGVLSLADVVRGETATWPAGDDVVDLWWR